MEKLTILLSALYITLATAGCTLSEQAFNVFSSVFTEATEGYENVKSEVDTKTAAVQEKIDKVNKAAEDLSNAANAVEQAIDSVQAINGDPTEETAGGIAMEEAES
ncbi:hypothetical protein COW94_03485 [Candidatus Peregrinibacteria bacterium CG22_combo_CG10-13_8_21_14_all_44_10]|nr:MAG: hypothetical protein AUK45_04940 [Candidatus Peregrinibacteria bacterium CG2_30_44_17]PIP66120.1 MAG: hypothetical protein COW94_03485 [Candidatus Peregrinibacteria bacterium CG22_combo_CG10-13_8_21_14_all_44_10]PIS03810.1 MAG: hypothetical protein COT83_04075 [Candidatus Peregrinibacteria bacterium CG10_big_fil_rev_8_21_14_0_10_44_7]PIX80422.1 MAG: hypothetical protein COZ35_00760 [Candidatus Peregrinibacteria bacterium CG_4_10_14_3_um_filter_44_21]PJB88404.1 MAG: hypothetical protein 